MTDNTPTVMITGATAGLGRALARDLVAGGRRVLVHGRDRTRVARLVAELGPRAVPFTADLSSLDEVARLAAEVRGLTTRLDVLVNNAAVGFGPPGQARQTSRDGHELRFAINYLAPVVLTRALLPLLTATAPARVLNVGSVGQAPFDPAEAPYYEAYQGVTAYRRSKLALAAFTFDLAEELRGTGVTVNCLHPAGFMDTSMVRESGVRPHSTVAQGAAPALRLITDPGLTDVTGEFFDGFFPGRARPEAYDPGFISRLRSVTDQVTGRVEIPDGVCPYTFRSAQGVLPLTGAAADGRLPVGGGVAFRLKGAS
ncbi:SDR family NAD(P)-dependent oxidoreductase [Actinacidiphila rubida]|uniref:Short-chain dehydrogenase n=1 Tax=Actinacidiphila rubida TaxID=310780 RepID=A0A1H8KBJ1_9ACTN|nr:SDR family NAD(P)-dependent oxidoreductase [Actinacidiphila rubida]SEN90372.1 Short-chain dehydrogenase [Actinacidiphila rubida]